jgi:hypothetical protein
MKNWQRMFLVCVGSCAGTREREANSLVAVAGASAQGSGRPGRRGRCRAGKARRMRQQRDAAQPGGQWPSGAV